ncbi:hypothetical protein HDU96_009913 [Phlyctochytrium bullatum]|nr:hypothetical protein HDU96_009913 [Phlyctochytrium bullatum]
MTTAPTQQVPVVDIPHVDANVIAEVFKLLSTLLGPDFATKTRPEAVKSEQLPFRLTITATLQHHATLALSQLAGVVSSTAGHEAAMVSGDIRRQVPSDVAPAAESERPGKRRRVSKKVDNLHAAAKRNEQMVLKLLEENHEPYVEDADGRLPIQLATSKAV